MKKNKLLFIIILLCMCTGCSVEYNINITENNVKEIITVNENITENRTQLDILKHYNMWYPTFTNYNPKDMETIELDDFTMKIDLIEYHEKEINETVDGYKYTYKYTYDIDDYHDAYTLARTYIDTTVYNNNEKLVLRTKKENLLCQYDYFDTLKVNITIDPKIYKLNYTNTTNISNNTYTWYLNKNNCNDSEIILTLDKINSIDNEIIKPNNNDYQNEQNKKNDYTMYIFCGILILLILIGYFIFQKIKKKNESFDIDD